MKSITRIAIRIVVGVLAAAFPEEMFGSKGEQP